MRPEIVEVFLAHELACVEPDVAVAVAPLLWRQRRQDAVNDVQNLSSEILLCLIHNNFMLMITLVIYFRLPLPADVRGRLEIPV